MSRSRFHVDPVPEPDRFSRPVRALIRSEGWQEARTALQQQLTLCLQTLATAASLDVIRQEQGRYQVLRELLERPEEFLTPLPAAAAAQLPVPAMAITQPMNAQTV